ncbi:Methyltransferase domain-containing protein [Candidatus Nitrotoga sp. HW29]|uniref:class I SAM-dependent methyltransferase n=1 Tax=Candidatus Nitrotoga sp. HW29 TaxID=2886963 RepID=UPI001EF2D73A|nr:class I SAM-dependent methyltransferase [Candidatus Nitrotoga sp. HW29]CAH1904805.1 Methyltransferase domain-containing protein [Candidatus Nitrotoga sp. HW29]
MTISKKYLYNIPDDSNHAATKISAWINNNQEILEIGCASGIQTRHFKENLGCSVTGIEIDALAAEDARPYCESLIIGSIEELDLPEALGDKRFDAITLADVLEHLIDPARTLIKVRPFLKEGGHLIASIPNIAHAAICWELAHGRFDYQKFGLLDNTHIRFFTKKNIVKLFEETGYRIISIDRVIKVPQETEFTVHCNSAQDQSFLDWISEQNPEAHTYQFIIKACVTSTDQPESSYQELATLDTIQQLESKIGELNRQNLGLKSQIAWLENHRFGPLTNLVDRLRNKQQRKN